MSRIFTLPYGGSEIKFEVPEKNLMAFLDVKDKIALSNPKEIISEVINSPINSKKLTDMVHKGDRVVIATADVNRRGDFRKLSLEVILSELKLMGIRKKDVSIIDSIGLHRKNTKEELKKLYGEDVVEQYKVLNHDAFKHVTNLGESALGDPVIINKLVVDADLVICIDCVRPGITTGYSGGSKMISVGVASVETILATHRKSIYWHHTSRSGEYLNNRFRKHLDAIAIKAEEEAKSDTFFLINLVTNSKTETVGVTAGDIIESYSQARLLADEQWKDPIPKAADIIITAPPPGLDGSPIRIIEQMFWFERMTFTTALKQDTVVIFPAICNQEPKEGTVEYTYVNSMRNVFDIKEIEEQMTKAEEDGSIVIRHLESPIGLAYRNYVLLDHTRAIFTVGPKKPGLIKAMHFKPVKNMDNALKAAFSITGSSANILIMPLSARRIPVIAKA